jgi:hypothetical protein
MKENIFWKCLIIGTICILMLPAIAVAATGSSSNYNLVVKVKNTKFFHKELTPCQLLVNVSNEGPDVSSNYSVSVGVYTLFTRGQAPRWFTLFHNTSYTGSPLTPNGYNITRLTFIIWVTGWYIVQTIVTSNDNNPKGDVAYCFIWVQFDKLPILYIPIHESCLI